jgi:hypothetical protein
MRQLWSPSTPGGYLWLPDERTDCAGNVDRHDVVEPGPSILVSGIRQKSVKFQAPTCLVDA